MMENIAIISELIKHGKRGTHDLYGKIPFFLRKRLDGAISCQPWAAVSEGCERNDPDSLERANGMYQMILDTADEYIRRCSNSKPETDNSTLMMVDRNNIQREFQDDAAKFASEMAKCLEREKELIFTYQASDSAEFDRSLQSEDIADQRDNDDDLKIIEELTQETSNQLSMAIKIIDNKNRYTGQEKAIFDAICQGHVMRETGPDTGNSEKIRHYTSELESINMNEAQLMEQLLKCKQNAIDCLKETCHRCVIYVDNLIKDLDAWKAAQAKRSVMVGPETDTSFLLNRSKRFGDVINTILKWFSKDGNLQVMRMEEQNHSPSQMGFYMEVGKLEIDFQNVLSKLFQVIVTVQPKGVISIENKGKKDSPNYCTKKTQPFTTTVRILAGECFQSFHITSKQVELVAEKDLAQGSSAPVTGRDGHSCLKVESSTGNTLPDIQFNIEVRNFCRLEQNNVYKQFFRLCYTITVSVNGTEYTLQTLSLPFTFNTGANQILEHMGARMWYCASVPDLYKYGFQCPDPLSADDLISILDNRVAHLSKKTRRLTEAEKLFLKSRLPVASDGTVTMQGFVKDKMKALRSNEPLSFSFYTWFYAVIHSIELLLLKAWQDGIIYGLCSEKTAEEILMNPNVPEGTFLLRPSISEIKKTSSVDATAAFVMEVKRRNEDAHPFDGHDSEFVVTSVPLFYKHIEKNTLYGAIKGIEFNGKPVAKFLYGRDGGRKLEVLKGYVKKPEERFMPEYRVLMEKFEKFSIRQSSGKSPAGEDIPEGDDDSGRESGPRKRRYRKPSSNVQGQSTSWSQPSALLDESSSGSGVLPVFNVLSSVEIKQENSLQFQSNAATNVQCQRSATQGKTMPDTFDGTACNGNSAHNTDGFNSTEVVYGDVTVDTSHISNVAVSSSPPYCQSGQASPQSQVTGYGSADYAIRNLEYANASIQQYNAQYKINGINNNHHSDSSNSPASNFNYPSPLNSSPPQDNYSFHGLHSTINMPVMDNLPTTINDARESKKSPRRQGNSRGNNGSASRKKAPASSRSAFAPLEINMNQVILLDNKGIQYQNHSIHNDSGFNPNLPFVPFDISSDTSMDFIGSEQLAASINEQRNNLQLSPDSGVGDQSPSPISSYINQLIF